MNVCMLVENIVVAAVAIANTIGRRCPLYPVIVRLIYLQYEIFIQQLRLLARTSIAYVQLLRRMHAYFRQTVPTPCGPSDCAYIVLTDFNIDFRVCST